MTETIYSLIKSAIMKNSLSTQLLFSITMLTCIHIHAADPVTPDSKITEVTIYPTGANVTELIDTNRYSGKVEFVLKNLASDINSKSIFIEAEDNIDIISFSSGPEFKLDRVEEDLNITRLYRQIGLYNDSIAHNNALSEALNAEKNMIEEHEDFSDDKGGVDVDAIIKASEFYRVRLKEIALELVDIQKQLSNYQIKIQTFTNELKEIDKKYLEKEYRVNIIVDIKSPISNGIKVIYHTKKAQWYPYYDIKVNDINNGLTLLRKAYVFQNTDYDWEGIKVTLSNADPSLTNQVPIIKAYNLLEPRTRTVSAVIGEAVSGVVLDQEGLPLIGANVIIEGTNRGTVTDIDGTFILDNAIGKYINVSLLGYESIRNYAGSNSISLKMKPNTALLSEIVVKQLSAQVNAVSIKEHNSGYASRRKEQTKVRRPIGHIKLESINSIEYKIEKEYTIKSGAKELDILISEEHVDAYYEYYAIPVQKEKAYLIAKIPDWHRLDLLRGNANLFLNNTYKGKSTINPSSIEDTLSISLGIDPEVIVKRKEITEKYDKKFFGKNAEESMAYEILIKNNKTQDIFIEVLDQIPITYHNDIKVKYNEILKTVLDESTGIIKWRKSVKAGHQDKVQFDYKVKYLTDMHVSVKSR